MSPTLSRRGFLGAGAAAGALAATGSLLPPSLTEAMARPMPRGGLRAVKHVVILMQENRSFDHYFGTMAGVRGFGDTHPLRLRTGLDVFHQPNRTGTPDPVLPFSVHDLADKLGLPAGSSQYLGSTPHSWKNAAAAADLGWWDNWIEPKTQTTMAYLDERDVAFQHELARAFTLCDAYHCSMHGGTNANRNYLWTGTTGFEPGTATRALNNDAYDYAHAGYDWTTYPERLQEAGVDWRIYQEWDNFTDNAVEYFQRFKQIGRTVLQQVGGTWRTTEELYDSMGKRTPAEQDAVLAQIEKGRASLSDSDRQLFDRAMFRSRPGTWLSRVESDIANGTLPTVSWLVPPAAQTEHPADGTPLGGADIIYRLVDAIASNREVWESTVLVVNFDENDGLFDHVPAPQPPRPASGAGDDWYDGKPIGLGPRVPCTVVSPWTVGGYVSSEVFDHTSTLRFLELVTGVQEPQISAWRRQVCGDLTGVFDFEHSRRAPQLSQPAPVPAEIKRWKPMAPPDQSMPRQDPGRLPARPLPYRPVVTTAVAGQAAALTLRNDATRSTHFSVYAWNGVLELPQQHDVTGAASTQVPAKDGRYDVTVQGPNRFWVDASGRVDGAAAQVELTSPVRTRGDRQAALTVANRGRRPVTLLVGGTGSRDVRAVVVRPGQRQLVRLRTDRGWYDLTVRCTQDRSFAARFTGHVEQARHNVTA